MRVFRGLSFALLLSALAAGRAQEWPYYAGDAGGSRYSALTQINKDNVSELELAWSYRTGALERHPKHQVFVGFQATPILLPESAGGHLVVCTPFNRIIAIDPANGEERWFYDPEIDLTPVAGRFNCRGVTQWQDPERTASSICAMRIVIATNDRRLVTVDGRTGKPCEDFGDGGQVDVTPIIRALPPTNQLRAMQLLSPVAIVNGVIVIGGTANKFKDASSVNGALRAFDARTGKHLWTFDTLIREGEGASDYKVGGANIWTTMSVDLERDLLFVPTASASPNFYGKLRPGDNRYANSILAIRGATGELVWHYQLVHHDVWDFDLPTHPILVDITKDGERIPVVVQLTKMGMVFVFHRDTGEPYFEIEERPVPTDGMPGDALSPTQPFPVKPPPLVRHGLTPDDAWGVTGYDRGACRSMLEAVRYGDIYTPIGTQGTVMYPQVGGGSNWGGGGFDPHRNLLVTPVAQLPWYVRLIPNERIDPELAKNPMSGNPMGPPGYIVGTDYGLEQKPMLSPMFSPCTAPPWTMLVGVDLLRGTIAWKVPLGTIDKLAPLPIPLNWGAPYAGGPVVTAGGLAVIGATADERLRIFDTDSGQLLWQTRTPTSSNATPMTYMVDGRQYIVISSGGHSCGGRQAHRAGSELRFLRFIRPLNSVGNTSTARCGVAQTVCRASRLSS